MGSFFCDKDTDSQDLSLQGLRVDGFAGTLQQLPQSVYPHVGRRNPEPTPVDTKSHKQRNDITSCTRFPLTTECKQYRKYVRQHWGLHRLCP